MSETDEQLEFERMEATTNDARQRELELQELEAREISETAHLTEIDEIIEEEEEIVMNELDREQMLYQAGQKAAQIYEEGQSFGSPSFFKYFVILIPWAIVVDIIDALDLTGIGAVAARAFSIFSWISILSILWFTDGKIKRAHGYTKNLEHAVSDIQKDVVRTTKYALKGSGYLSKVPGMKGIGRQIPRTLIRIRRVLRKNPLTKVFIGGAINAIPLVAILNLLFVWVYLSYRDEKKNYKEAAEASKEAYQQISENLA